MSARLEKMQQTCDSIVLNALDSGPIQEQQMEHDEFVKIEIQNKLDLADRSGSSSIIKYV